LEELSEDWRELNRTISHNLRTPLAVIKGCTAMLLAHPDDEELDDERRRELLVMTSENVERLADAITWLEGEMERLSEGSTIHLPADEGVGPPGAGGSRGAGQ
jgi:K+-sensing histidine kinase KdpD